MLQPVVQQLQKLNWPIRTKIGLAFAIILACFVVNGIISTTLLLHIKDADTQRSGDAIYLERLQRFQLAYQSEQQIYLDAILMPNVNIIRDYFKPAIISELDKGLPEGTNSSHADFEAKFGKLYNNLVEPLIRLQATLGSGDYEGATKIWQQIEPTTKNISQMLDDEQKTLKANQATGDQELNRTILLSVLTIGGAGGLSVVLVLLLLYLIGQVLVNPLNKLQESLKRVSEGDLNQDLEIPNRDEVGKLANSFKMAVATLQQVIRGVHISESLAAVTGQLSVVSQQQASGSIEQVTALSQVTAAMQELGKTAGQIADNAIQVAELTGRTLEQIRQVAIAGQESQERSHQMVAVVERTMNGVDRVGKQVEEFSRVANDLNEQSEEIGKVVTLISSIANEVHLLALNAAIEAAGAGEYGERFKVVAFQIRQLAGRANRATQEARNLISGVQVSAKVAIEQVETGQKEVAEVVEINAGLRHNLETLEQSAQQVGVAVNELSLLAEQVSIEADEIRQATQQQHLSSEQVIMSVRSAGAVAEQSASTTGQIAASSSQLQNLANQLNGVLGQIKLAV